MPSGKDQMRSPKSRKDQHKSHKKAPVEHELQHSNSTAARSLGNKQRKDWMSGLQMPVIPVPNRPRPSTKVINAAQSPRKVNESDRDEVRGEPQHIRSNLPSFPASFPDRVRTQMDRSGGDQNGHPQTDAERAAASSDIHRAPTPRLNANTLTSPSPSEGLNRATDVPCMQDLVSLSPDNGSSFFENELGLIGASTTNVGAPEPIAHRSITSNSSSRQPSLSVGNLSPNPNTNGDGAACIPQLQQNLGSTSPPVGTPPLTSGAHKRVHNGLDQSRKRPQLSCSSDADPPYWSSLSTAYERHRSGDSDTFKAMMKKCERVVTDRLEGSLRLSGRGSIERPRLELIREACRTLDYSYLMLHQLYCCSTPVFQESEGAGLDITYRHAFQSLKHSLASNDELPHDASIWFTRFPGSSPTSWSKAQFNETSRQWYSDALGTIKSIAKHWEGLQTRCFSRNFPPLVSEIRRALNVYSPTLQQVIFRAMLRNLMQPNDIRFKRHEAVFTKNQQLFVVDGRSASASEGLQIIDGVYANEHHQISIEHLSHPPAIPSSCWSTSDTEAASSGAARPHMSTSHDAVRQRPSNQKHGAHQTHPRFRFSVCASDASHNLQNIGIENSPRQRRQPLLIPRNEGVSTGVNNTGLVTQALPGISSMPPRTSGQSGFGSAAVPHQSSRGVPVPYTDMNPNSSTAQLLAPQSPTDQIHQTAAMNGQQYPRWSNFWLHPSSGTGSPNILQQYSDVAQPPQPHTVPPVPLHHAHLSSPKIARTTMEPCFRYIKRIHKPQKVLSAELNYYQQNINVTPAEDSVVAKDTLETSGLPVSRPLFPGSLTYRVRCIKTDSRNPILRDEVWVVADHFWPDKIAILLNEKPLEFRRKSVYGKDLPVDVTRMIKAGQNSLTAAVLDISPDTHEGYLVGLEVIETITSAQIRKLLHRQIEEVARQRIIAKLSNADPDIEVLNPEIVLDLTDPFSATMFTIPVRGRGCLHDQCFDLETFLASRGSTGRNKDEPCPPDEFRCPVCKGDVRPGHLVIDGFYENLREVLKGMGRLDIKAVRMSISGKWEIKEEDEVTGESGDGGASGTASRRASEVRKVNETINGFALPVQDHGRGGSTGRIEVIELDD